jgi:cell division protease FtsH
MKNIKNILIALSLAFLAPQKTHPMDSVRACFSKIATMLPSSDQSLKALSAAYLVVAGSAIVYMAYRMYKQSQQPPITTITITPNEVNGAGAEQTNQEKTEGPFRPFIPAITFQNVAGATVAKEELQDLVAYIKNPEDYTALGATAPKGILLYGPPGTGKTLLAKAVAGETACSFIAVNGTDFASMYIGTAANNMRALFAHARAHAPCILFIDEIDTIGKSKDIFFNGNNTEYAHTLNQLLVEMDGFVTTDKPVIVIAATNRPGMLDDALLRPGRFDKKIEVGLPTQSERLDILKVHAQKVKLDPSVDLTVIARGTAGLSGADLAELLKDAARIATKAKKSSIEASDLELARDTILVGQEHKSLMQNEDDRKCVAYHEAGHALVRLLTYNATGIGLPLHKVTMLSRGNALGITWSIPQEDRYTKTNEEYEAEIAWAFGGRLAEELVLKKISTAASGDLQEIMAIAHAMVFHFGMSPEVGPHVYTYQSPYSATMTEKIDQAIRTIIDRNYTQTRALLEANLDKLHIIAQALLERETLSAEEVYKLLGMTPVVDVAVPVSA